MSARPFTESEFSLLSQYFASVGRTRDRLLLVLGCATGFRIHEILSLTVAHVWDGAEAVHAITIARHALKGGRGAYKRTVRSRRVQIGRAHV